MPLKPTALEVRPRHIPQALKKVRGWLLWRWWWNGKKWTKPPYNADGVKIDAGYPDNWVDFSSVLQAYRKGEFDGIGFSLDAIHELAGVDLDHCIEVARVEPWALEIIEELGSYAEISPSGEGVRVLGYGRLRKDGRKKGDIEMYDGGRYLTVTGHKLDNSASDLVDFDEVLNRIHARIWRSSPTDPLPTNGGDEVGDDLAERFQALCDDDPIFRERFKSPAAVGDRSDLEFHLCAKLWESGFNEAEIWHLMDSSPQTKWRARDDAYKERTIRKAISAAASERAGRSAQKGDGAKEAREYLETIKEGLKEDPRKLKDRAILKVLLTLRENDPLEFDIFTDGLKAAGLVKLPTLKKMIDAEARRLEAEKDGAGGDEEDDEAIMAEAAQIISEGRSFERVTQAWQSRHLGDAKAGKALIVSIGAQSCTNTAGIHVILNGPRGCGKSDVLKKAAALLPSEYLLFGDMSAQAVYYHTEEMPEGAVIAFDDITWNDTYASVQKRCTTRFQEGADHRTVVDGKPKTFKTKPRLAFWCTSVDRQFDEQLQDRYFAVNIEDSLEHKAAVIKFMKARDAGIDREEEERETRICRAILQDLKNQLFEVVIPFADRITLLPGVGERGYKIISDMVKAFCAFRYAVRETDDRRRLVATEEDFEDAKALFDDAEGHSEEKYTEAEKKVLRAIIKCAYVATLENLADVTGLSSGRLKDIINGRGRDEQQRHGLLAKCHSLTVERVSETVYFEPEPDNSKSKTVTRNEYRLDRNFALSEVYNSLVYLEPATGDDDVPRREVDVVVDVKETDGRREVDVDDVLEEREIENTSDTSRGGTSLAGGVVKSGENFSFSPKTPDDTSTTKKEVLDNDLGGVDHYVTGASGYVGDVSDTSTPEEGCPGDVGGSYQTIAENLEEAERREDEWKEHVRTPDPTSRPVDRSDTSEESAPKEETDIASATQKESDQILSDALEDKDHESPATEEFSDSEDAGDGLIFGQPESCFRKLSGSQGLTAARLRKELGWDIEKAKIALELLRKIYNWQLNIVCEHKIYFPPSYSEDSVPSCPS